MTSRGTVKRTSEEDYKDRVRRVLGRYLSDIEVFGSNTRHPQIGIDYVDYKPSDAVRKELEAAMPEVEFYRISRIYSNAALVTALMSRDEGWEDPEDIKILTTDSRVMSVVDYLWDQCHDRDFTDLTWQRRRFKELSDDEEEDNKPDNAHN